MKLNTLKYQQAGFLKAHILFWAIFITYELAFYYSVKGFFAELSDYIAFYTLNIFLFYINADIVHKAFLRHKTAYGRIILYSIVEITFYFIVRYLISASFTLTHLHKAPMPHPFSNDFIRDTIWRAVYFLGLSTAYAYINLTIISQNRINDLDKQALKNQLQQQQLQQNLLASENAFLKAQINPHFLFNMLAFLYNSVRKLSDELADQVMNLSDLMRYALSEPESDGKVSLHGEIEHIENYLELNKARFNNILNLEFDYGGELNGVRVIPLVMITVVENIIKYGNLSDPQKPAIFSINVDDNQLHLHVENKKIKRLHIYSSGIGMVNIKKRLDLAYPGNNRIEVQQDELNYRLDIFINLSTK